MELTCLDYVPHARDTLPDYEMAKDDVLFSGTVDLMTDDSEESLRYKICEVLSTRLPRLEESDFDLVKVSRKTISTPVCSQDQKWDFAYVKVIAGQGKLYVRLNKPKEQLAMGEKLEEGKSKLDELSMMFPSKNISDLERALSQNLNDIHSAIADLLDDDEACVCHTDV